MNIRDKASTGMPGIDQAIDKLRLGDNVVWQVDTVADYKRMVERFAEQSKRDDRKLVYVRFGDHEPLLEDGDADATYRVEAEKGFESFATAVHTLIEQEGRKAFYVFDSLTDLLQHWHSDLMIGNFFKVACPFLYELDTVAYFAIIRNAHTYGTIASIRETTQLLLELYQVDGSYYVHPLKVWNRYSPTMFFPHLIRGEEAVCITASTETAELFSSIQRGGERLDYWDILFQKATEALALAPEKREETKRLLMSMMIGPESRMSELCDRYFTLEDILAIASREIGTGFIGGKSVGMLVARKVLEREGGDRFTPYMEPHDSFYLGTDVYYTYIVQNGWWKLRTKQRTPEGYFRHAPELKENLLRGKFPEKIREKLMQMLEYFGQSPIIVRSSSLLEDNFGNAFAGKYESVFCANQGTPEERFEALEQAIRTVYASTMNEDALQYRMNRGLFERDEQMAILVQRVSGDHYDDHFFPHLAGVGNSSNLYVWDKSIDMDAGMLRLVFGLGTRAVDRTVGDYVKIVSLDNPQRSPLMHAEDYRKYSQHDVDVLSLKENALTSRRLEDVLAVDLKADKELFATQDYETMQRLRELGYSDRSAPHLLDFQKLLKHSEFPGLMRDMLALLSRVYDYPVDIEFTANFTKDDQFKVNLLQCRPLQTRGLGKSVEMPTADRERNLFFEIKGNFMGGNVRLPIDYVVYVRPEPYLACTEQGKYAVARQIGVINAALKGKQVMLIGPGRWGTTTPSLGVPIRFSELSNMSVICEVSSVEAGFMPELSYGSHFFQDLVESGIFYAAIFDGRDDVKFQPARVLERPNLLMFPNNEQLSDVIHIAKTDGMELFSDIVTQRLICL
ncbi:pyruvate kinase [Paenibacillus mesophilus]|uniref:PEP/pyruvate-binding domain-containing protein n=1 Tax=Paenibacillus mesophilus TaxID=2582849 RepID=UPI00110EB549|nr:PEP/pyruvate-binding domain-containing protein [Paenibacillus mesophilus]TMV53087.1 pyruvate kinase [Paenibacillus mesophilus]